MPQRIFWQWACITSVALAVIGPAIAEAGHSPRNEPAGPLPTSADLQVFDKPGCSPVDGRYDPGGTLSWIPNCAGEWFVNPASPLLTMSVVGVPSREKAPPFTPDFAILGSTQALIQAIARNDNRAEVGLTVNFDVARGGRGGNNQKVGIADFVRLHPGSDGSQPGSTWAFNPNIQVAAKSGNVLAINTEADFNNFNDCNMPGCFSVMLWHNYLSGYPITADTYISGDSSKHQGLAQVAGRQLNSLSGDGFTKDTRTIRVDGRLVRVDDVSGPRSLTLGEDLGQRTRASYSWNSHLVHTGLMIANDNAVADQDFLSSSSGYYAFYLNGHHNVLLAAAGDAAPYVVVARPGQSVCFNGVDGCLFNANDVKLRYQVKGNTVFEASGSAAPGANYPVLQNGAQAARISVDGPAASAPLELSGKNGSPVAVKGSPFQLPIYTIGILPPCRPGTLGEVVYIDDLTGAAPPVWHGIVQGGGHYHVRSAATCNGDVWQYS